MHLEKYLRQQSLIIDATLGSRLSGNSNLLSMKPTTPTTFEIGETHFQWDFMKYSVLYWYVCVDD